MIILIIENAQQKTDDHNYSPLRDVLRISQNRLNVCIRDIGDSDDSLAEEDEEYETDSADPNKSIFDGSRIVEDYYYEESKDSKAESNSESTVKGNQTQAVQ